jgi:hypothetical protein
MRLVQVLLLFFSSASLQAAVVTFEDLAPIPPVLPGNLFSVSSGGYVFSTQEDSDGLNGLAIQDDGPTGNFLQLYTFPELWGPTLEITHSSGQAFELVSLDIGTIPDWLVSDASIRGYDSIGNEIAAAELFDYTSGWVSYVFDDDWNAVHRVVLERPVVNCSFCPIPQYADLFLDNLTVNVVPIPAAVWLFGSALAGLGWFRRRQTA